MVKKGNGNPSVFLPVEPVTEVVSGYNPWGPKKSLIWILRTKTAAADEHSQILKLYKLSRI